jgi:hypothetical protein
VLRQFSYEAISAELSQHGLVTEQLHGVSFPQRRFASDSEREAALLAVADRGLDPSEYEETGWYHADFYLSRPRSDAAREPVESLLAGLVS